MLCAWLAVSALLAGCTPAAPQETGTTATTESSAYTTVRTEATEITQIGSTQTKNRTQVTTTRVTRPPITIPTSPSTPQWVVITRPVESVVYASTEPTLAHGEAPLEKNLTFNGATFTYYYCGASWSEYDAARFADFEKTYNVKLKIRGVPTEEYGAAALAALHAGTPVDVLELRGDQYPLHITHNIHAPLSESISDKDFSQENGFCFDVSRYFSVYGKIYGVGGTYLSPPAVLFYDQTYLGNKPVTLYEKGAWTWENLYTELLNVQDPENNVWGIHLLSTRGAHQLVASFNTDIVKATSDGRLVQNLSDPQIYKAFQVMQEYSVGEKRVCFPKTSTKGDSAIDDFRDGKIVAMIGSVEEYDVICQGLSVQKRENIGVMPLPGSTTAWEWRAYGAGNGTSKSGVLCALAFAKHEAAYNQQATWQAEITDTDAARLRHALKEGFRAPFDGFRYQEKSMGGLISEMADKVTDWTKKVNITVLLKGYEKLAQKTIDEGLKA